MMKVMNLLMNKTINDLNKQMDHLISIGTILPKPNEHRNESSVSDKQGNKSCKLSVEKIQVQKEAFIQIQNYASVSSDSDNLHKRFNEFCQSVSEKDDTWSFWRQFHVSQSPIKLLRVSHCVRKSLIFNMVQPIDLIFYKVIEMIEQNIFNRADFSFRS